MISAIILAGGESKRFGTLKPIHRLEKKTFLDLIIEKIEKIPLIQEIIIGVGFRYNDIILHLNEMNYSKIKIAINPDYKRGQLSTLQECLKKASEDAAGYLVILSDHPFVDEHTYRVLIERFIQENGKNILIPVYGKQPGHPVIFPHFLREEILESDLTYGLDKIFDFHKEIINFIEVIDKHILSDIDTIDELEKILREELRILL